MGKVEGNPPPRSPRAVVKTVASETEISTALESLYQNKAQLLKLQQYAAGRIAAIGRAAEGHNAEDLLTEAVTRTLEGRRNWNKTSIDLVGHLIGVVKSISSHWAEEVHARKTKTYLETEVTWVNSEGQQVNELQQHACTRPSPERAVEAERQVRKIEDAFKGDSLVTEILSGMEAEMTGPEIQQALSITQSEYETAMKRLRRKAKALALER